MPSRHKSIHPCVTDSRFPGSVKYFPPITPSPHHPYTLHSFCQGFILHLLGYRLDTALLQDDSLDSFAVATSIGSRGTITEFSEKC